jgi:transposase
MSSKRYTDEFKTEAVKQVLERGHSVAEVARRLGINKHSLYDWTQRARRAAPGPGVAMVPPVADSAEVRRLRADLRRMTEERDILKKAAAYFARG